MLQLPCRSFNPPSDPDRDIVGASCGSDERAHFNGRCPQDLSRTRVFEARTKFATPQASTFQASFSQPTNFSSNTAGNATFETSNATQATTGNQQTHSSASVPGQCQGQAARGNHPVSANQVSLFADEEQQIVENYMLIENEEPRT